MKEICLEGIRVKSFRLGRLVVGVACDVGPRILWLSHEKRPDFNLFGVLPETGVQTPEGFWHIYGGHRLWTSPEAMPRSYSPDDRPVSISTSRKGLTINGQPETANSVQKSLCLTPIGPETLKVVHTITNIGRWPITLAAWALSVMRPEGLAVVPVHPSKVDSAGLLPDRHLTLWPYTDLSDPRLSLTRDYLFLRQDPKTKSPVKIGTAARPDWTAYWVDELAFIKTFHRKDAVYPDYGCTVEVYTNAQFLELETVGPLESLAPGSCLQHIEYWRLASLPGKKSAPGKLAQLLAQTIQEKT